MLKNALSLLIIVVSASLLSACQGASGYLQQADEAAYSIIAEKQAEIGVDTALMIDLPEQRLRQKLLIDQQLAVTSENTATKFVADTAELRPDTVVTLSLLDALQVAAHNSRRYQGQKESVFRQALALDLERDGFRNSFAGLLSSGWSTDKSSGERVSGLTHSAQGTLSRQFKSGIAFATSIGLDLVQLLTANRVSARGVVADASLSIPLLRGAGREIVTEPLQQAERDVLYALWDFERFRRSFSVQVASDYLLVLERFNQVDTAFDSYQRLVASRQRARRLADAGRLPEIQVDQALQDELRARSRWVGAQQTSADRLDNFKLTLGLPVDARIELERSVLTELRDSPVLTGSLTTDEIPVRLLIAALDQRRDLRVAQGRTVDRQRAIRVAEDRLRGDVTLLATGSDGSRRSLASADSDDAQLNPDRGLYSAVLSIDLPLERTAERNILRNSWIDFEQSQRDQQQLSDEIKYQVRSAWRGLQQAFENIQIQSQALKVAQRRVASTDLFLQAGRIQIRDLLEAQDDLVSADNALVEAQVQYRIRAMELLRDLGMLEIDAAGQWLEDIENHDYGENYGEK